MELTARDGQRWPDPESGPFDLWTTYAVVDGRPEVVGVELWAIDPASLPKRVTHLTNAESKRHWPRFTDAAWESRRGVIRTKDLRVPLGRVLSDFMARQRRHAWAVTTPGFRDKIARTLDPSLPGDHVDARARRPEVQAAARAVLDLTAGGGPRKSGRPALPVDHYREVARVYTEALREGDNPTAAVQMQFSVSKSAAAKWIHRCRRDPYNFLPPTNRGRPAAGDDREDAK